MIADPKTRWFLVMLLLLTAASAGLRLPRLPERPMHGDEANQAVKTGKLLENNFYRYDPHEHHGPALYYFAALSARLSGARTFGDTTETTYRIVPALFGVGLIALLWFMRDGLGRAPTLFAALFLVISPAMVYYSRYFIQETLLVFFTALALAGGWRYARRPGWVWALVLGVALGLMHATKETCVLTYAAMAVGLAAIGMRSIPLKFFGKGAGENPFFKKGFPHFLIALAAAVCVSVLFFSSFFTNARGPLDSILTYVYYLDRADGAGIHDQPWYFYLKTLLYTRNGPGPWWSEAIVLALAVVGLAVVFARKGETGASPAFQRFIAVYTLTLTALYSLIPYKTPWSMLSFYYGVILLAGIGASALTRRAKPVFLRFLFAALIAVGAGHLLWQTHLANGRYAADWRNPYAYAHPVRALLDMVAQIEGVAAVSPEGRDTVIKVMRPGHDYWPLPWYLRKFKRVGYWDHVPPQPDAGIIITAPALQAELQDKLTGDYMNVIHGLRPDVLAPVYIRRDLWDAYMASRK